MAVEKAQGHRPALGLSLLSSGRSSSHQKTIPASTLEGHVVAENRCQFQSQYAPDSQIPGSRENISRRERASVHGSSISCTSSRFTRPFGSMRSPLNSKAVRFDREMNLAATALVASFLPEGSPPRGNSPKPGRCRQVPSGSCRNSSLAKPCRLEVSFHRAFFLTRTGCGGQPAQRKRISMKNPSTILVVVPAENFERSPSNNLTAARRWRSLHRAERRLARISIGTIERRGCSTSKR